MNVRSILQIIGGTGEFTDAFGNGAVPPGITLGVVTNLVFDLRGNKTRDDLELPAYDLPEADSYYIAIDNDWSKATVPKLLRTTGISVDTSDGYTLLTVPLPNTAAVGGLAAAIETSASKSLTLHCEIGGNKSGVGDVFAYSFDLVIRNRIWLPDSSPEDLPSDPDYLNTTEVQAYINAAVATALENIVGDTGPAPTITMGTVTTGATPGATLTPVTGEDGAYTLDLVMPVATGPTGPARQFGIGTITDGTEAAASLDLDGETYLLSLTLPRGQDGINPRGQWAIGTTYAINDVVRQAGAWWRSLQDDNTGNEPPATRIDNAWWEIIVKDGLDADPLLRAYNDTDDPDDTGWHTTLAPGDTHFRESIDGGANWTIPMALTASQGVIELYNIDATTDWSALTAGASYSTGYGKWMRARQDGGVWGEAYQIHELAAQALRVQFSTGGAEPTWHATLQAGDKLAKFYNTASTINQTVTISDGTFEVAEIQLCAVADPWHATYDSDNDTYRKISIDGGATYTDPMPLQGKSAYQEWLDLGNTGTAEDFLDSLKIASTITLPGYQLLIRPATSGLLFLQVKFGTSYDLASAETIIDTENEDDRAKVLFFNGTQWGAFPEAGLGSGSALSPIRVDMTSVNAVGFVYYRWIEQGGGAVWQSTPYPSNPFPGGIPAAITGVESGWPSGSGTGIETGVETSQPTGPGPETQGTLQWLYCPSKKRMIPDSECTGTCVMDFDSCPVCGEFYISSVCLAGEIYAASPHECPGTGGGSGAPTHWEPPDPSTMWCPMTRKYIPVESCIGDCTFASGSKCLVCGEYLLMRCRGLWWELLPHDHPAPTGMTGWEGTGMTGMTGMTGEPSIVVPDAPPAEDIQVLEDQACKYGWQTCPTRICQCSWFSGGIIENVFCPDCGKLMAWHYICDKGTVTRYSLFHVCGAAGDYSEARGLFYYGQDLRDYVNGNDNSAVTLWNYRSCIPEVEPFNSTGHGTHYKIKGIRTITTNPFEAGADYFINSLIQNEMISDAGTRLLESKACDGSCQIEPAGSGYMECVICRGSGEEDDLVWNEDLQDYEIVYVQCSGCSGSGRQNCFLGTLRQGYNPDLGFAVGVVQACEQCIRLDAQLTVNIYAAASSNDVGATEWGIVVGTGTLWALPGGTVYNLPAGTFDIVFRNIPNGLAAPASPTVTLTETETKSVSFNLSIQPSELVLIFKDENNNILEGDLGDNYVYYKGSVDKVGSGYMDNGASGSDDVKTGTKLGISNALYCSIKLLSESWSSSPWVPTGMVNNYERYYYNIALVPGGSTSVEIVLKPQGSEVCVGWYHRILNWSISVKQYRLGYGDIWTLNDYYLSARGELVYYKRTVTVAATSTPTYRNMLSGWSDIKEYAGVTYGKKTDGTWWNLAVMQQVAIGQDLDAAPGTKAQLTFGLTTVGSWSIDSVGKLWFDDGIYTTRYLNTNKIVTDLSSHVPETHSAIFRCS